jgi:uncharacterized protein (AIM24 family)
MTHAAAGAFRLESSRILRVEVHGGVWIKPGAALAYHGDLSFARRPTLEASSLADAVLREMAPLVRATGRGRLFCGHGGCHVHLITLDGSSMVVASEEVLAFEDSLAFDATLVEHGLGLAAGGLTAVRLSGHGTVAMCLHGSALSLPVTPEQPLCTDPHATVAWSGTLSPHLKTDLSWRSVVGHGGQEPVQMHFSGTGEVLVQPSTGHRRFGLDLKLIERLRAFVP